MRTFKIVFLNLFIYLQDSLRLSCKTDNYTLVRKRNTKTCNIQLFQLSLSPSKVEKSNTSAKSLLGIAKKIIIFFSVPSKPLALVFDFSTLLGDNLN